MNEPTNTNLRRELGLLALIFYGVGDILGAGIYALVGKIAGIAGAASWLAFCFALAVAALTALSYAELGSRFPRSGGESYFCQRAFQMPFLAFVVGWLVFCSGVVSLATVSRAFVGYLFELAAVTTSTTLEFLAIALFLTVLGGINFWGIKQSSRANILCTTIEASGLLLVILSGVAFLLTNDRVPMIEAPREFEAWPAWTAIGQAAAVAFFAFIGFEDMVNVAEEVRSPERNLPIAILVAVVIAGGVYIAVVWVATAVVPATELASSQAPLLVVIQRAAPAVPAWLFTTIALFAVANTGLLNFIMASRLLYGMAQQRLIPVSLGRVHATKKTPHVAILCVFTAAFVLAFSGTLVYLAGATSALLLAVFLTTNLSLLSIKRNEEKTDLGFRLPIIVPAMAAIASVGLIGFLPANSMFIAVSVVAFGVVLGAVRRGQLSRQ